jgi:hypothetical protein
VAAVGIGLALLLQGASESIAGFFGLIGLLALVGAVGMGAQASGRVGPARQASCCGCSCTVALLVIPSAGALLWAQGGPAMAVLAFPAWIPLSWAATGVGHLLGAIRDLKAGPASAGRG